jgi:hypothetical protein
VKTAVLPDQDPLYDMDALRTRISFAKTTTDTLEPQQFPDLGDEQVYLIRAVCTGRGLEQLPDGEKRKTVRWEVTNLEPQGDLIKPTGQPNLFQVDDQS